jgi:hypothetical protein
MIGRDLAIAVWFACLAGMGVVGGVWAGPAERAASIVFVPGQGVASGKSSEVGTVEIRSCRSTSDGLLVQGRVSVTDGATAMVVSPGPIDGGGVGVSAGYASSASKVREAEIGDFVITLPWASASSSFEVLDPEAPSEAPVVGSADRCPAR